MSKQIIAIWAEARNHVIGKNHTMPWHLPAELAHFKKTTMGSAILMGRVTFDGMNRRCLPGRETLILTRDKDFDCEEVTTVTSVEEALAWFEQQDKDLYIAGGAGVYKAFDGYYDVLIKTTIEADFRGRHIFSTTRYDGI